MTSSHIRPKTPTISIIGRPNVGKSTLFNRLLGKRRAITDSLPGVTRDPIEAHCEIGGRKTLLIDTGGYRAEERDVIEELVGERMKAVVESSDLILLVLDVDEMTSEDELFIDYLQPFRSDIVLVINKVDSENREWLVWDFYKYGFKTVIGISAVHNRNIDRLIDVIADGISGLSGESRDEVVAEDSIKIAVLGKPNTGKSTLANILIGSERSIVSEVPGTTRDVIESSFTYNGKHFTILDTAGIRRKKKVTENVEYYSVNRAFRSIEESDVVYLLIDSIDGVTDQDKKIAQQVVKRGRGIILVLTKWDKMEKIPNLLTAIKDRISFVFPILSFAPIVNISAVDGTGIKKLLTTTIGVHRQLLKRIETPLLNRTLQTWVTANPPPQEKRIQYKARFLTQAETNPVVFVLFVNKKAGFPRAYIQFIKNKIRAELGFSHVPIKIEVREKQSSPYT